MFLKVFVCYHKYDRFFNTQNYYPIHVGKRDSTFDLGIDGDETGDNISSLNLWYCELTAQYWIWKNVKDVEYVGLCHYRRFFDFHPAIFDYFRPYIHADEKYVANHIEIPANFINQYDVILPRKRSLQFPIFESLCMSHIKNDVVVLGDIIREKYSEYYTDYKKIIIEGNKYTPCNMIIAKKHIFDDYSKWLFGLLFEFEKRLTIPMDPYQPRLLGYYSERLLFVYLHHHSEYKVKYLPLVILDNKTNKPFLLVLLREKLRSIAFLIYKFCK